MLEECAVAADTFEALEREIARFRAWADAYPIAERGGEWECDYRAWQDIYHAFAAFVATPCQQWSEASIVQLLYIIARDNDNQILARTLGQHPENLLYLAERAGTQREPDATWQLAVELGRLPAAYWPRVEPLLLAYLRDPDEYVRRRVLSVLADGGSAHVREFIQPMWESGDEYQRMTALYALWKTASPVLPHYLALAKADGRPHLVNYADRIQRGEPMA